MLNVFNQFTLPRNALWLWRLVTVVYLFYYAALTTPYFKDIFLWNLAHGQTLVFGAWLFAVFVGGLLFLINSTIKVGAFLLLASLLVLQALNPLSLSPEVGFYKVLFFGTLFVRGGGQEPYDENALYYLGLAGSVIYLFAGIAKVLTANWLDGSLLYGMFVRPILGDDIVSISPTFFVAVSVLLSYGAILAHIFSPVFCYYRKLSSGYHITMLVMYLVLLALTTLTQVVVGMMIYHGLFVLQRGTK